MEWVNLMKDGVKWSFYWEEIQDFLFFLDFLSIFSHISIENWKGKSARKMDPKNSQKKSEHYLWPRTMIPNVWNENSKKVVIWDTLVCDLQLYGTQTLKENVVQEPLWNEVCKDLFLLFRLKNKKVNLMCVTTRVTWRCVAHLRKRRCHGIRGLGFTFSLHPLGQFLPPNEQFNPHEQ